MDRTTTYIIIALVVLLGIGAMIYASRDTVPTSATGAGSGTTGTTTTTPPPPAPAPATPGNAPVTVPPTKP